AIASDGGKNSAYTDAFILWAVECWHSGAVRNITVFETGAGTPPPGPERRQDDPGGGEG
ncbi:hypothetical protein HMPREF1548_06951, partial [Clostridium sp. KLE 1755]